MSDPGAPRRKPRVLVVHNGYQIRGGEEAAVERDVAALRDAGVAVELLSVHNSEIETRIDRLRTALEAPHAPRGIGRVMAAMAAFRPEVVHVHNTFPLISPGVHAAIRAAGAATVQTLHNYRVICANGMLTRNGHPCEDCVGRSPYRAVLHACYRGSRIGSLAVARTIDRHRRRRTWHRDVDRFIALTPFAKGRFVADGLPADRIVVRPNSYPDPGLPVVQPRAGFLYVGRLVEEKGLAVLAEAARGRAAPVTVIGEGPMMATLAGRPGLDLVGPRDAAGVRDAMARATAVVVPSLWYEGLPNVVVEAFAAGTPVIASRIGSLADVVEDGVTGLLADPGDARALARAFDRFEAAPDEARHMGAKARTAYEDRWTEGVTIDALLAVYAEASASHERWETNDGT